MSRVALLAAGLEDGVADAAGALADLPTAVVADAETRASVVGVLSPQPDAAAVHTQATTPIAGVIIHDARRCIRADASALALPHRPLSRSPRTSAAACAGAQLARSQFPAFVGAIDAGSRAAIEHGMSKRAVVSMIVGAALAGCSASEGGAGGGASSADTSTSAADGGTTSSTHGATGATTSSGSEGTGGGGGDGPLTGFGVLPDGTRDKTKWPFASDSIWNTPIGADAQYLDAGIAISDEPGYPTRFAQDQDIIVMRPDAPQVDVSLNHVAWAGGDRCPVEGLVLQTNVPMPDSLVIPNSGDNNSAAFLGSYGHTLIQNEPFTRCSEGAEPTTNVKSPNQDIYGDGIVGAHGGSGLSAIGGTLRFGELTYGNIRHALKINLWAHQYYHCCSPIWPAHNVDGYANGTTYGGDEVTLGPGSLMALQPSFDIDSLETEPGKILARAFQNYGAYTVDDTFWNAWAIETEQGPDGRVVDEFQSLYGTSMSPDNQTPFRSDIDAIFTHLAIVTNNTETNIGGGGAPRAPLAPAIGN